MLVGLSLDPKIKAHGVALWYDENLVMVDLFKYGTKGDVSQRALRIAQALATWLRKEWVRGDLDWIAVEDQILRSNVGTQKRFMRSPNKAIMTLKTAADTAAAILEERFSGEAERCVVWRPLPEAWKGSMSKQATEIHLIGNPAIGRPGRLTSEERGICLAWLKENGIPLEFRKRTDREADEASDIFDAVGIGLKYVGRW